MAKKIVHTWILLQPVHKKKRRSEKDDQNKKIMLSQDFINLVGIHRCFIAYSNNDDEYWVFFIQKKSAKLKELHVIGHEFATNCELKRHIKD